MTPSEVKAKRPRGRRGGSRVSWSSRLVRLDELAAARAAATIVVGGNMDFQSQLQQQELEVSRATHAQELAAARAAATIVIGSNTNFCDRGSRYVEPPLPVIAEHHRQEITSASARRIAISAPDGTPVSVAELASDANFIAKPGGSFAKYNKAYQRVYMCSRCGFSHKSLDKAREHVTSCVPATYQFVSGQTMLEVGALRVETIASSPHESRSLFIPTKIDEVLDDDTPPEVMVNDGLSTLIGMTGMRITDDNDTEANSVAPSSVATSAITLQSTLHSRERVDERELARRDLQAAVKHGEARRSHTGNWVMEDEKTCVVIASGGVEEDGPAPRGKVVVTAWGK
tara:strand:- start:3582 stop:4610 length:1029 start_codon:yes stop_codon:yes gene_type:complete